MVRMKGFIREVNEVVRDFSRRSRKGDFCGVRRVRGLEREMCKGSWAWREVCRRVWSFGGLVLADVGERVVWVEVMMREREASSVGLGYPRAWSVTVF